MIPLRLLIFLCMLSFVLRSQIAGSFIENSQDVTFPFTITQFSTKQGLPQSQVTDIISKRNGCLFVLTANGIVEYNGYEFKPILQNSAYKKNIYTKLLWHEKTKTLFGEHPTGALHQILPDYRFIHNGKATLINGDSIYYITASGDIYISALDHLAFRKKISTHLKDARCIFSRSGIFLIGTGTALYQLETRTNRLKKLWEGESVDLKENLYDGLTYLLSAHEVYKVKDSVLTMVLDTKTSKNDAICQDIEFIDKTSFYVGTNAGLYEMMENYVDYYNKKNGLPSQFIHSLYYNQNEDCLFAGTGEKGLLKLQQKNCYSLSSDQGFKPNSSLSSIIRTSKNEVLVGEADGSIFQIKPDTISSWADLKKIFASLAEINGIVFAGTWGGGVTLIKDKKTIGSISYPINLPGKSVHASFQDSRGGIWIGTGKGISFGTTIQNIKPLLSTVIKQTSIVFYELKNGNICAGGNNGVYILNKDNMILKHIGAAEGFQGREVRAFYEDNEGKLWIGSYDGGLFCWFKDKLISINKLKNCLLDKDVFCLAKDHFGYFYITSNHGLWRLKEKDLSDFYYGKKKYLIPFYYGEETGILNTEFNGGFQNNYLKTNSNHFYFPTLQGVVVASPEEPMPRKLTPTIERVLINDTLAKEGSHDLNPNTYSIEFDFSCVNFLNKYNVYYQYKLDGQRPSEWSILRKDNSVMFKLLSPGNYTFSVRAVDAFNDPRPNVTSFVFTIKPHFYETLWFRIVGVLIFFTITIIVGRVRVQGYRRKAEEKEFLKRTMAELELKAIQAQLNPHFIFNCLNTIKYFILDQDFEKANKGLNHFSKMLRDVIKNSDQPVISIKSEIVFLTDYLELEKMRLQDKLNFNIWCERADQEIIIPAMLIQPHVENAMKHGIGNLIDKKGELSVGFHRHSSFLEIRISDNGIGRLASSKISKRPNHISHGISLTADKSEVFKKLYNTEITTEIIDLYSEDKKSEGTLVIIKIPLHDDSDH